MLKKQLPIYMARELNNSTKETKDAISTAFVDLDQDVQQRFYSLFPGNIAKTHEKDIREALARQPDQKATQAAIEEAIHGSCALTVYIKDGVVYSANTGDSRVVSKLIGIFFLFVIFFFKKKFMKKKKKKSCWTG